MFDNLSLEQQELHKGYPPVELVAQPGNINSIFILLDDTLQSLNFLQKDILMVVEIARRLMKTTNHDHMYTTSDLPFLPGKQMVVKYH